MDWWHDWWTSVARFFGYDEWVWGSAADWFAAVGTVGALVLGLILLRGEQVRRDRVDADFFVTSAVISQRESSLDGFEYTLHVRVKNHGPNSVRDVVLMVGHPTKRRQLLTGGYVQVPDRPAQSAVVELDSIHHGESAELDREVRRDTRLRDCYITFADWRGRVWVRSLGDARYRSNAHLRRRFMPLSEYPDRTGEQSRPARWRYGPRGE